MRKIFISFGVLGIVVLLFAGTEMKNIPGRGIVPYVKEYDGTYSPQSKATTIQQEKKSVNPYTETTASYSNVKAVEIYNDGKSIRIGFNDTTTADTDNYWIIPSTAVGYSKNNLDLDTLIIRLKGDTTSDTATVRINVFK